MDRGRLAETDSERSRRRIQRDREDDFFCISFPDSFDAKNLSVCNAFLTRVLSTLTAPLWINVLIVAYLILV